MSICAAILRYTFNCHSHADGNLSGFIQSCIWSCPRQAKHHFIDWIPASAGMTKDKGSLWMLVAGFLFGCMGVFVKLGAPLFLVCRTGVLPLVLRAADGLSASCAQQRVSVTTLHWRSPFVARHFRLGRSRAVFLLHHRAAARHRRHAQLHRAAVSHPVHDDRVQGQISSAA